MSKDGRERFEKNKWKPGQSGNPSGRPANIVKKALRKFTIKEYRRAIEVAIQGDIEKLERVAMARAGVSALRVGVARSLLKAIRKGDWSTFEAIAARIVGKIPDHLVLEGDPEKPVTSPADPAIVAQYVAKAMKKLKDEF